MLVAEAHRIAILPDDSITGCDLEEARALTLGNVLTSLCPELS